MRQRCFFRTEILIPHAHRVGIVFIICFPDADFQDSFKDRLCVVKNTVRRISETEIGANDWVEINLLLTNHAPLRDTKRVITLAPETETKPDDCDPHSLVSLATAGNVVRRVTNLLSAREGEDRNPPNIFQQGRQKNVTPEITDSDERLNSTMPEQQSPPSPKLLKRLFSLSLN
jgi:hypothetical protein